MTLLSIHAVTGRWNPKGIGNLIQYNNFNIMDDQFVQRPH